MNYSSISQEHEGKTVLLQGWGFHNPMQAPPIERKIASVSAFMGSGTFKTEEPSWNGELCERMSGNWRVATND